MKCFKTVYLSIECLVNLNLRLLLGRQLNFATSPTIEANEVVQDNKTKAFCPAKRPGLVESMTKYKLRVKNPSTLLIPSSYEVQFGQYRGMFFRWVLENAVDYAVSLIESIRKEGRTNESPIGVNKTKFVEDATTSEPPLEDRELVAAAEARG